MVGIRGSASKTGNDALRLQNFCDSTTGMSMVEFAFVALIFFFMILGILDLARFMTIRGVLTRGAQRGLNIAQKLQHIDIDMRASGSNQQDLRRAFDRVIEGALQYPLTSGFVSRTPGSSAELLNYRIMIPNGAPNPIENDVTATLLRPGDSAIVTTGHAGTKNLPHPTKPTLQPAETLQSVLRTEPLYVELRADVDMFLPFFGTVTAVGAASGFREGIKPGSLPGALVADPTTTTTTLPPGGGTVTTTPPSTNSNTTLSTVSTLPPTTLPRRSCSPISDYIAYYNACENVREPVGGWIWRSGLTWVNSPNECCRRAGS